jgi:hypothetical protein
MLENDIGSTIYLDENFRDLLGDLNLSVLMITLI